MFCKHCGVHVFSRGYLEQIGGDYCSVNLSIMDLEPATLATIPVRYFDGRNNNWMSTPQFTGYL